MLLFLSCEAFSAEINFSSGDSINNLNKRMELEFHFFNSKEISEKVKYKIEIAKCFEAESKFNEALDEIDTAIKYVSLSNLISKELVYESYYQKAFCLFVADSFALADASVKKIFSSFPDSLYSTRLTLLSVLISNHFEKYNDSKNLLIRTLLHLHIDTAGVGYAYSKEALVKYKSMKKTIRLARFLPGAGFFYMKKSSEGFVSAFLNVAFIGYTAYSIYTGYYITATFTGLRSFMRFHGGGVRASAVLTKRYNENVKQKSTESLDKFCLKKLVQE